jgi:hypothetical protein
MPKTDSHAIATGVCNMMLQHAHRAVNHHHRAGTLGHNEHGYEQATLAVMDGLASALGNLIAIVGHTGCYAELMERAQKVIQGSCEGRVLADQSPAGRC